LEASFNNIPVFFLAVWILRSLKQIYYMSIMFGTPRYRNIQEKVSKQPGKGREKKRLH